MDDPTAPRSAGQPRLNEPAPDFRAATTEGVRRLADYRGKWLVLISLCSEHTAMCTSELVAFARVQDVFERLNTEILALSAETVADHHAWLWKVRQKFDLQVDFPIAEDPSLNIARAYGALHPAVSRGALVAATFVIDPRGGLRAMSYYPTRVGRQVSEVLRLVQALQASDDGDVYVPDSWRPVGHASHRVIPLCRPAYRPRPRAVVSSGKVSHR